MITCMTAEEAAEALQVKLKHVYYLLHMGRIEGWKIRDCWRIFRGSVEEYVKSGSFNSVEGIPSRNHDDAGYFSVSSMLNLDCNADALAGRTGGLFAGSGMEHHPGRLPDLSVKTFKPIKKNRPISAQIEFNFSIFVDHFSQSTQK